MTLETTLVMPAGLKPIVEGIKPITLKPGDTCEAAGASVKSVPAYNTKKPFHPRKNGWLGYVITTGGKVLYHAGDTDTIPEMNEIGHVDIAFLPIGGIFTMDMSEAIEAIKAIKPVMIIPIHELWRNAEELVAIAKEEISSVTVHLLKSGESISF